MSVPFLQNQCYAIHCGFLINVSTSGWAGWSSQGGVGLFITASAKQPGYNWLALLLLLTHMWMSAICPGWLHFLDVPCTALSLLLSSQISSVEISQTFVEEGHLWEREGKTHSRAVPAHLIKNRVNCYGN